MSVRRSVPFVGVSRSSECRSSECPHSDNKPHPKSLSNGEGLVRSSKRPRFDNLFRSLRLRSVTVTMISFCPVSLVQQSSVPCPAVQRPMSSSPHSDNNFKYYRRDKSRRSNNGLNRNSPFVQQSIVHSSVVLKNNYLCIIVLCRLYTVLCTLY